MVISNVSMLTWEEQRSACAKIFANCQPEARYVGHQQQQMLLYPKSLQLNPLYVMT
jgi:hypothetical protein